MFRIFSSASSQALRFGGALLTAAGLFFGAPTAFAASPMTTAFVANLVPNLDFLERSSRLALDHAGASGLHSFAAAEVDQIPSATAVAQWFDPGLKVAQAADLAPLQTGRSVATGAKAPVDPRTPLGRAELDALAKLQGKAFDDLYWEKQVDALKQVESDYATYIAVGDDPVLRALATRELPKVRQRLQALTRL